MSKDNMKYARDVEQRIAQELGLNLKSVAAVCQLLEEGSTIPFIARYRKEMTGNLDEVQVRDIEEKRLYLTELEDRRAVILKAIKDVDKLTPELQAKIEAATSKSVLEDLYLPYRPKRRTRATVALEKGLEPLADLIWQMKDYASCIHDFIDPERGVQDAEAALAGARDICAQRFAENAEVREQLRRRLWETGILHAKASRETEKSKDRTKFEDYYDFRALIKSIKSHQFLAIRRGEKENVLRSELELNLPRSHDHNASDDGVREIVLELTSTLFNCDISSRPDLLLACIDGYKRLLFSSLETEIRVELKQRADREAVEVFATNLRALLLDAPLGERCVMGIDPGLRTGCKCVMLDERGTFLETATIFPHTGKEARAQEIFVDLCQRYKPSAIAIGNGTGGRETEQMVRQWLKILPETSRETQDSLSRAESAKPVVVMVSESGASIYSASDVARDEFPDLDLTVRGAISIGRRLQDPLSELVKIDPKSIGVGQYQHDVFQPLLKRKLEEVVESCVNHVGVELNTASRHLLEHVAGISPRVAEHIVSYRTKVGGFTSRCELLKVAGLGPKTYEQCAGFLRVKNGTHPLDASAVHPERYGIVQKIALDLGVELSSMIGNDSEVNRIELSHYVDQNLGRETLTDILAELRKPGRDPRAEFEAIDFDETVHDITDLRVGQKLSGVITNVTHFGAFVDIGVHQDGLVHISELAEHFVSDPAELVKLGDRVQVWVIDVDVQRRRISLSRRGPKKTQHKKISENSVQSSSFAHGRNAGESADSTVKTSKSTYQKRKQGHRDRARHKGVDLTHNPFSKLKH